MEPTSGNFGVPVATYPPGSQQKMMEQVYQGAITVALPPLASMAAYHPLYTIKTMLQTGALKTWQEVFEMVAKRPHVLFRGIGASMGSSPPLALKSFVNDYGCAFFARKSGRELTSAEKMVCALFASATGGVFATIFEQVVSHQQVTGENFMKTCRHIAKHGVHGFGVTVIRETFFGGTVFGVSPYFQGVICQKLPEQWGPAREFVAAGTSSIFSGLFGAAVSHPADVIKTAVQTNATMTYGSAVKALAAEGPKAFFKGFGPRAIGFVLVTNVMTISRIALDHLFDKKQK